jgi:phosphatidylinositol dimannoside acyltransferase
LTRVAFRLGDRLTYYAYAAGWGLVRRLPERAAYQLFDRLADAAWRRQGPSVRRLEANLARVLGPAAGPAKVRALSRAGMRSYLRYWCDVFRLPDWDHERTVGSVRVVGEEHLRGALAAGRGFLAALPHSGNWDHVGAWACRTGAPVTTVAERLRPERLYERFLAFRQGLGMEIIPLTGGQRDLLGALADAAGANRAVCLLADRDLRASGVDVTFFGEPARLPAGPALLALRSGAPLHPVVVTYAERDGGHGILVTIHPAVPVPRHGTTRERAVAMTQALADVFATAIAAAPQDWHMLQRLWLADLERPADDSPVAAA